MKLCVMMVRTVVTPSVTRPGTASGLIQKETHETTTINPEGKKVEMMWYVYLRCRTNTPRRQGNGAEAEEEMPSD